MLLFKKKLYFYLYIFFLIFVFIINEFSTNEAYSKNFIISGVVVEEKYDLNFNKSKVIDKGFIKASHLGATHNPHPQDACGPLRGAGYGSLIAHLCQLLNWLASHDVPLASLAHGWLSPDGRQPWPPAWLCWPPHRTHTTHHNCPPQTVPCSLKRPTCVFSRSFREVRRGAYSMS